MRGCRNSPASRNEACDLELPGFEEWPGDSRSSGCPETGGPRCSFSFEDKDGEE